MGNKGFKYTRSSDVTDGRTDSLILEIYREKGAFVAAVFCRDDKWQIILGDKPEIRFTWYEFLEIFHQASLFVAGENAAMLAEYKENARDAD